MTITEHVARDPVEIVENVGRALAEVFGDGSDLLHYRYESRPDGYHDLAEAAIRATLQYARDNVSEEAAEAFRNAAFAYREAGEMTPAEAVASILSALLTQIEGGEKP